MQATWAYGSITLILHDNHLNSFSYVRPASTYCTVCTLLLYREGRCHMDYQTALSWLYTVTQCVTA